MANYVACIFSHQPGCWKWLSWLTIINAIITWEETFQKCLSSSRHRTEQANFQTTRTLISRFCQCQIHSSFQKAPWTTCCAQLPLFTDLLKFSDTSHQAISKRFNLPEVHPLLPVETAPCSVMKSIHPCFGQNVSIRPLHEIWVKVVSFSNAFSTIPIQHSNIHLTHLHLRIEALIKRNSTKRSCINVIYQLLL